MGPIPTTEDTQEEDQGIDLGNLSPSYAVSSTPHTRIHKDHPIDHVIGDVQSSVQTRRMTTSYSELGFIEASIEELFSVKTTKCRRSLARLPKGHRAIGTKWVYRNKKDERGIVIADDVDESSYDRSMIGSKMYLTVYSPDICQPCSLCMCKDSPLELVAYTDSDYDGDYIEGSHNHWEHNMVAFLEKSSGSAGFHQIIDFLNRSHICYALTKKPEVCVSFIRQFWRTAETLTDDNGGVKINATIDGHSLSITEGSLRRHHKMDDK
ncbi:hypothetical protein Tco_1041053 [Tanacetum coccineum]|uniref:Uncharacterized protein n=1 Tax=Tanacetum coccineum TaxID=301880 RepID=A0ABQ5GG54_9ASTR